MVNHSTDGTDDAGFARRMFGTDAPLVDARQGYLAVMARRAQRRTWTTSAAIGALAAGLLAAFIATPLGGYGAQLLTIFEPKTLTPIAITASDAEQLRLMPRLTDFGTFANGRPVTREVSSPGAAAASLGYEPRVLASLPATIAAPVHYYVVAPYVVSYTFSAAKARAYAARYHRNLPEMPAGLDGTTIRASVGPVFLTVYGKAPKSLHRIRESEMGDAAVFAQLRTPRMTSTGAGIATLEQYLLSMPNVPPSVATQLRAIGDPTAALPVPFLVDKSRATPVDVDGVRGLAVGDQTGLGASVVWQRGDTTFAIAGSIEESEAIALANSVR